MLTDFSPSLPRFKIQQTEENRKQLSGMEEELEKCPDITAKFEKEDPRATKTYKDELYMLRERT